MISLSHQRSRENSTTGLNTSDKTGAGSEPAQPFRDKRRVGEVPVPVLLGRLNTPERNFGQSRFTELVARF